MYLKITHDIELLALGHLLSPGTPEEDFDWDYENVYEWMYVNIRGCDFALNISREHGMADLDDKMLDKFQCDEAGLEKILKLGPTYVMGWNRTEDCHVDALPESLIQYISDKLRVDIAVHPGFPNVDVSDSDAIAYYRPR